MSAKQPANNMDLLSINDVKKLMAEGAVVIDTRPSAFFVQGFIPRSIHIPVTTDFKEHLSLLLELDIKVILLTEAGKETSIARELIKTGFINLAGIIEGGYEAWTAETGKIDIIIDITPEEFEIDFNFDEFYLIDLRDEEQYEQEHFEYAENIPLIDLEELITELNTDATYYLYGNSLEETALAASIFKRNGFHKLRMVNEGYQSIKETTKITVIKKKKPKSDIDFSAN